MPISFIIVFAESSDKIDSHDSTMQILTMTKDRLDSHEAQSDSHNDNDILDSHH